jgi:hypothetical protein
VGVAVGSFVKDLASSESHEYSSIVLFFSLVLISTAVKIVLLEIQ